MPEPYLPTSEFLNAVFEDEAPLIGSSLAEENLRRLIEMMEDADLSNRDWATFLLAQTHIDTVAVRDALLRAARDNEDIVRAEAVLGLAQRDPRLALPLVQTALRDESIWPPTLEAAAICAHPSLIDDLRVWAEPSDAPFIDKLAADALEACLKTQA